MEQTSWIHVADALPLWMKSGGLLAEDGGEVSAIRNWPDREAALLAKVVSSDKAVAFTLDADCLVRCHVRPPRQALIQVLLVEPGLIGQVFSLLRSDL